MIHLSLWLELLIITNGGAIRNLLLNNSLLSGIIHVNVMALPFIRVARHDGRSDSLLVI